MGIGIFLRKSDDGNRVDKCFRISLWLSVLSFVFSIIVLCKCFPRLIEIPNETGFDYIGFIVGTLSFLVAILAIMFGYNIFDFKNKVKREVRKETEKLGHTIRAYTFLLGAERLEKDKFLISRMDMLINSLDESLKGNDFNATIIPFNLLSDIVKQHKIQKKKLQVYDDMERYVRIISNVPVNDYINKKSKEEIIKALTDSEKIERPKTIN